MKTIIDPFELIVPGDREATLAPRDDRGMAAECAVPMRAAATARFEGFDPEDQPLVSGLPGAAGQVLPARTSVPLRSANIGSDVVVLFDRGDPGRPIVVGMLEGRDVAGDRQPTRAQVTIEADGDRVTVSAEREIALRCGDASIILTRAGKVIIEGRYIVSRSTGYNKVKGAAVDIN